MDPEGYHIITTGNDLIISGGRPRGTLYGVYALLEEQLRCRWFAPGVTRIPKHTTIHLPALNLTVEPQFEYRELNDLAACDPDWAAHNRIHVKRLGNSQSIYGGGVEYVPGYFVHTFNKLVPSKTYFSQHPEYYALVKGERKPSQLCLTNPDVRKLALEEARRQLRLHPDAKIISISQNDGGGYCTCPDCQAVVQREGSQSGPILEFANYVAAGLHDEFPDKAVDTLAYYYSEKPPKNLKPLPNVIVRLCSYGCCSSHPLADCDSDESRHFRENLNGWHALTNRIWIWDYTVNYANFLQPFPNLWTLQPNIQYFAAHGVRGVFEEGDYVNPGGELKELRDYLLAKILWNPDCNFDATLHEFLEGYYGPAAPQMQRYLSILHKAIDKPTIHVGLYDRPTDEYLNPEICRQASIIFDEAEQASAGQPEILQRVRAARLGIDYVMLATWKPGAVQPTAQDLPKFAQRFLANATATGVKRISEGTHQTPAQFIQEVLRREDVK